MVIYFLRHASAGEKRANPKQDEKRPLDKLGIEQSRYVGRALALVDTQVDAILSSPLKRATQTAALVGNELGYDAKIHLEAALRPEAGFDGFRSLIRKYAKFDSIMVIGHNPSLTEFCSLLLTAGGDDGVLDLKKGAVARVEYTGKKNAVLEWCLTPKLAKILQSSSEGLRSRPNTARK